MRLHVISIKKLYLKEFFNSLSSARMLIDTVCQELIYHQIKSLKTKEL